MAALKLSQAQEKTLRTIHARGGEMNGWAGQSGFYTNSISPLLRMELITAVENCPACDERWRTGEKQPCQRPLQDQKYGDTCYGRVRITDAGRALIGVNANAPEHPDRQTARERT